MARHFLPAAASRTISLRLIYQADEDAAYTTSRKLRGQDTDGGAVCPRCSHDETYEIGVRRRFRCRVCRNRVSVNSGTIFASRKMAFVDLLAAICTL